MLEHVAMYVARLRSGGRKHYNMRSVLRGIFWNAHSVLCMSGAAGDGRTIPYPYIYIYKQFAHECLVYVGLAQARPNHILRALLYRLCGARSGSPQLRINPHTWRHCNEGVGLVIIFYGKASSLLGV